MAIRTEDIHYQDGAVPCIGTIAYDDARAGRKPAVLIGHEAGGISPNILERASRLAELGYVGFAADIFGERWQPTAQGQTRTKVVPFVQDPAMHRTRALAGLSAMTSHPQVDATRLFAIGYCFGGTTALELARSGAPLLGAVSFHGGLTTLAPAKKGEIKASILVCHGADDPHCPIAERLALEEEMRAAGADWQLIVYGNTEHNFTSQDPRIAGFPGMRYVPLSDQRSWLAMRNFFEERLAAT